MSSASSTSISCRGRGWRAELRLFQEALDQVALADKLGSTSPGRWSTASSRNSTPRRPRCSSPPARAKRIRLGHGIVLMPLSLIHPPPRRHIATLDLVSNGRVEWVPGGSASAAELGGFRIDPNERRHVAGGRARPPTCW